MDRTIRFAVPEDSAALLKIYGQYIDTPVTFEYELPSEQEFAERIAGIAADYPYLVWEEGGVPVGYAYAHRYGERAAYQWGAELSIYLERNHTSCGMGKVLYEILMELLKLQGVRTVYGCVTVPNEKSMRLHEGLGFRRIGEFRNAGYKNGAWRDVMWLEKELLPCEGEPKPILSFSAVPEEKKQHFVLAEKNVIGYN